MNPNLASTAKPDASLIFNELNAFQRSAALKAAIDLDLFTLIAEGQNTAEALATALSAPPRGVRILCDFLVMQGLLSKQGSVYANSLESSLFLNQQSPGYFGGVSRFLLDPRLMAGFHDLAQVVRTGRTTLPDQGTVSDDNPIWVEFARHMAPMMFPASQDMAEVLAGRGPLRVLDLAAGHGVFGVAIAQRNPEAHVTALDWENVLAVATENAEKMGVATRYAPLPGSAFTTDFGGPYDLVLVTNFFHHFDQATCVSLMKKVAASLAPGGRCATLDFVPNEDRVTPWASASFAIVMLGSTVTGDAYTAAEYQAMLAEAGYTESTFLPLAHSPETLIVSTKAS